MKRIRKHILLLLLSLAAIVAFSAAPILAHDNGDNTPPHSVRAISCEYIPSTGHYVVKAFPPNHATAWWEREDDVVHWKPVLYQWNGSLFIKVREAKIFPAYAYVTPYGLNQGINPGWRSATTHGQMIFMPFYNLPSGTYSVLNVMKWESNGHVHSVPAPNSCTL